MKTESIASRRQFLCQSAGLVVAASGASIARAEDEQTVVVAAGDNRLFRVRMEMEVEGNVNVPRNPLVSRKRAVQLPVKSDALFDYEERLGKASVETIERFYHTAESTSRVNRNDSTLSLRPSVQNTLVSRETLPEVVYSQEDYFHRDELDLLRVPASSAAVDQLLPTEPVKVGSTYQPNREALAAVLNLSSVDASDIEVSVVSIDQDEVRFQFKGKADGSVEGVPTLVRVVGKLTFNRMSNSCTWLAMSLHETREISLAEPGFDVAAKIRMIRQPMEKPVALGQKRRSVSQSPSPERLYIDLQSEQLGIGMLMDRKWRMMRDVPGTAMMRMIDRDRSVAQCDFRPLVALESGKQWTMESFQRDVRQTLGEQLTELVEAEEQSDGNGMNVLRLTANGAVQGVPIHWIILHFTDAAGRRMLATFTMESSRRAAFGGADAQLASSLRFTEPAKKTVISDPESESGPSVLESGKEVAAKIGEVDNAQVQSGTTRK